MAKVNGPCFSFSASGNIKKTIVFTTHKGQPRVKWYKKSEDARTHDQLMQRGLYQQGKNVWLGMSTEEKAPYRELAKTQYPSGYSLFLSYYLLNFMLLLDFLFAWLISIKFDMHVLLWGSPYRSELLVNMLTAEGV